MSNLVVAGQCARWEGEGIGDYTAGVIRACRGTRPGDALRPNRQPQKPRQSHRKMRCAWVHAAVLQMASPAGQLRHVAAMHASD